MSDKDWRIRLAHIVEAMENAKMFVGSSNIDALSADNKTLYALMRCFQIMGEAAKHIPDEIRKDYPNVPWKKITGFRDVVVHDYDEVDVEIVYNVIHKEFPLLEKELQKIHQSVTGL